MKFLNTTVCFSIIFIWAINLNAQTDTSSKSNKVLVVSGGGAKGSWGAGLVTKLNKGKAKYKLVCGTSTGSLIAPFVMLQNYDKLKEGYTKLKNTEILYNPENLENLANFILDGKGLIKTFNSVRRNFQLGYICNSEPLKEKIKEFFPLKDFDSLKLLFEKNNGDIYVASLNLVDGKAKYNSLKQTTNYDQFVNWIWSSCNEPVYMVPYYNDLENNTGIYVDGGIKDNVPLNKMIELIFEDEKLMYEIDTIDVIVHHKKTLDNTSWKMDNTFSTLFRMIDILRADVRENDLKVNYELINHKYLEYKNRDKDIVIRKFFMPEEVYKNFKFELKFDEKTMLAAYEKGFDLYKLNEAENYSIDTIKSIEIENHLGTKKKQGIMTFNMGVEHLIAKNYVLAEEKFKDANNLYPKIFSAYEIENFLAQKRKNAQLASNKKQKGLKTTKQVQLTNNDLKNIYDNYSQGFTAEQKQLLKQQIQ